jgi:hypothetical protein
MTEVCIKPMPESYRKIKPLYRPGFPPIFGPGDITADDRNLARELFQLLDDESKAWYGTQGWLSEPFEKPVKSKKSKRVKK